MSHCKLIGLILAHLVMQVFALHLAQAQEADVSTEISSEISELSSADSKSKGETKTRIKKKKQKTEAERALERSLSKTGALLLPAGEMEFEPSFLYTQTEIPLFQAVSDTPSNELDYLRSRTEQLQYLMTLRIGFFWDSQIEFGLPYNYIKTSTVTQTFPPVADSTSSESSSTKFGRGDYTVALAKTFMREKLWRPDGVARVQYDSDSSEKVRGLDMGTGFVEYIGTLTFSKRQDPLVFVTTLKYQESDEKDSFKLGREVGYTFTVELAASPETSINGSIEQSWLAHSKLNGIEVPGSDSIIGFISFGMSVAISNDTLLAVSGGVGITDDSSDYTFSLALPMRVEL